MLAASPPWAQTRPAPSLLFFPFPSPPPPLPHLAASSCIALGADKASSGLPPDSTALRISPAPMPAKGCCLAMSSFSITPKAYTSTCVQEEGGPVGGRPNAYTHVNLGACT